MVNIKYNDAKDFSQTERAKSKFGHKLSIIRVIVTFTTHFDFIAWLLTSDLNLLKKDVKDPFYLLKELHS